MGPAFVTQLSRPGFADRLGVAALGLAGASLAGRLANLAGGHARAGFGLVGLAFRRLLAFRSLGLARRLGGLLRLGVRSGDVLGLRRLGGPLRGPIGGFLGRALGRGSALGLFLAAPARG